MTATSSQPPDGTQFETGKPSRRSRRSSLDVPKIRLLSWLGAESVLWAVVIAHLAKWAFNFQYFATWQVRYIVGYGETLFTVWYGKDFWDRLVVHIQNGLPGEAGALCGLIILGALLWLFSRIRPHRKHRVLLRVLLVLAAVLVATGVALGVARGLAGWHVHWFTGQDAPAWWVRVRHGIRDVGITLAATIAIQFLFTKPHYPLDDAPTIKDYALSVPKALGAALIPIAIITVIAWKISWIQQHGFMVPASYGPWASEANGWIAAGTWITVVMGIAGGIVAKPFVHREADDVQWFFAQRSAAKIRSTEGLNALRGSRIIGTPAHRKRVRWILDNRPDDTTARNPWLSRLTLAGAGVFIAFAIAGAWLAIWGPAAVH